MFRKNENKLVAQKKFGRFIFLLPEKFEVEQ